MSVVRLDDYRQRSEPMVTKRQLAERLSVSERWIEKRMLDGLPRHKWSTGAVRFRASEVVEWLDGRSA